MLVKLIEFKNGKTLEIKLLNGRCAIIETNLYTTLQRFDNRIISN